MRKMGIKKYGEKTFGRIISINFTPYLLAQVLTIPKKDEKSPKVT